MKAPLPLCPKCREPMDLVIVREGWRMHPMCEYPAGGSARLREIAAEEAAKVYSTKSTERGN